MTSREASLGFEASASLRLMQDHRVRGDCKEALVAALAPRGLSPPVTKRLFKAALFPPSECPPMEGTRPPKKAKHFFVTSLRKLLCLFCFLVRAILDMAWLSAQQMLRWQPSNKGACSCLYLLTPLSFLRAVRTLRRDGFYTPGLSWKGHGGQVPPSKGWLCPSKFVRPHPPHGASRGR